jgi:hypothetical protein
MRMQLLRAARSCSIGQVQSVDASPPINDANRTPCRANTEAICASRNRAPFQVRMATQTKGIADICCSVGRRQRGAGVLPDDGLAIKHSNGTCNRRSGARALRVLKARCVVPGGLRCATHGPSGDGQWL